MAAETQDPQDQGAQLMQLFVNELIRRLTDGGKDMVAAELNVVRQLLSDNSITLARIKHGEFGTVAKKVAEEFPFDVDESAMQ